MLIALLLIGSGAGVLVWRHRRIQRLDMLLDKPVPRYQNVDLAVGAGVTAMHVLHNLSQIDGDVLEAIDAAHGGNDFDSTNDLLAHVNEVMNGSEAQAEGLVSLYKGHLGELELANSLREAGHHVEMAATPNQEGWDAIVDGTPTQFKSGLDAGGIEQHLADNPEIPIITVSEHAVAFADNGAVIVVDDVSGVAIEDTTRESLAALEGVDELGNLAAIDIPLVTLAFASVRHRKRLRRGHANLGEAVKDTTLDVASVGVGGAAGAKVGALIGGLLGPMGAGAGGLVGAVGGAVFGRIAAMLFHGRKLQPYVVRVETCHKLLAEEVAAGLLSKEGALVRSTQRLRPRGPRSWLNPTLVQRARTRICAGQSGDARQCKVTRLRIQGALNNKKKRFSDSVVGRELVSGRLRPSVFSAALKERWCELEAAVERLLKERERVFGHK